MRIRPLTLTLTHERICSDDEDDEESEMAIELKRGDSLAPKILCVPVAPNRVIPPALLAQTAPTRHQIVEERETHLHQPSPLQNEPDAAGHGPIWRSVETKQAPVGSRSKWK
ncbi:hypothetical protein ACLOJK_039031 [Asimina triloba]